MNLKFWIGSISAGALGLCGVIAEMPPALENQIPQLFPENKRGYLAVVFAIAAYVSHHFASAAARNALVVPSEPVATKEQPVTLTSQDLRNGPQSPFTPPYPNKPL